ncbi:NADH-quinone oxidoreductase subunit H [Propionivibrio dicarboxylicus]|uniref:NADH-quinone oxidoreductase subunit H n=2 Tax=Propionivibrio dicarboxylicus TaxID=83767 RepID=A0A1G8G8C8_9RHOO|nr:NADH-quinone oxidoreductase subunit NuoH [Propionivibrio dicarboxylicus]SDH90541.1 NADH-quinone oxidoreductase subunit H [Propionivibrio dicarboxylicus]
MMVETLQQLLPGFLLPYLDQALQLGAGYFGPVVWQNLLTGVWAVIKVMLVIAPLLLVVAYTTYAERKVIGAIQVRIGPNRVGPLGLIQPLADGLKVMLKEVVIPAKADRAVFLLAPVFAFAPALVAWAVIPFNEFLIVANVNAGLLFVMAVTSISVYGIILAGWASNSKYAFLGAMRSAAQMISYEVAMGLSLVVVMMISSSLNLVDIVKSQDQGLFAGMGLKFLSWNWLSLWPMFVVYLVSIFAECNRAPFDLAEGESEIVGYHVEYSGMAFAVFQLAEYSAMLLGSTLVALLFLGGWLSPVGFLPDSILWLFGKIFALLVVFFWARSTFPRYRYDQVMRLGWKVFIPVCLTWLTVVGVWMMSPWNIWK